MIAPSDKGGTQLVWEDWRGNLYTVGSLVLYARMSGRSCEMAEGRVVDLYEVYYDNYKWNKLAPGESVPEHEVGRWKNTETGEISKYNMYWRMHDGGEPWEQVRVIEPKETERRAKIMPTNRTSRFGGYYNQKWVSDDGTGNSGFIETEQKPIILKITESVTAVTPYDIKDDM